MVPTPIEIYLLSSFYHETLGL